MRWRSRKLKQMWRRQLDAWCGAAPTVNGHFWDADHMLHHQPLNTSQAADCSQPSQR
jgi:hypothetical protein